MNKWSLLFKGALSIGLAAWSGASMAVYVSGSTGADGAFNPTASQSIQLPPSGVFNYTSVNIPPDVTITYKKNADNTPVTILVSGDVAIAGTINVSATPPLDPNDISGGGLAGPGGFNGGRGGLPSGNSADWVNGMTGPNIGRTGAGPGGGSPATLRLGCILSCTAWHFSAGGGGAFGTADSPSDACSTTPGVAYGNLTMLPLIGGSGGGGGAGGSGQPGWGGGGGGGAILIAASGTISVTGAILANGGVPPFSALNGRGTQGGGGSGGAIRLIATTITGNGVINAVGGVVTGESLIHAGYHLCSSRSGGRQGGAGRIRLESETLVRSAATSPTYSGGAPNVISIPGLPKLAIASIAGIPVPANPSGSGDVTLAPGTPNPVTVVFTTRGVTVGSAIKLTVLPAIGVSTSATSAPTTGTADNATGSVDINLPGGQSVLQASVTYTVLASAGDAMSTFAQGERVEKIQLSATLGGPSMATLITVSGKEYPAPAAALALAGIAG